MTLESVYYIGQTIAVVAILGSLVAIFFQLLQTNKISRFNAAKDVSEHFNTLNQLLVTEPGLRQALLKADGLAPDEDVQVYAFVSMFCNVWLSIQMAHDTGQTDEQWFAAAVSEVAAEVERWPAFRPAAQEWLRRYPQVADLPIFRALRSP